MRQGQLDHMLAICDKMLPEDAIHLLSFTLAQNASVIDHPTVPMPTEWKKPTK